MPTKAKGKYADVPAEDFAGPHRSFPIDSPEHFKSALHLVGHADDPAAVRARAIAIAKRKGYPMPAGVKESDAPATAMRESVSPTMNDGDVKSAIQREMDAEHEATKPRNDYSGPGQVGDVYDTFFTFTKGYDSGYGTPKHFARGYKVDGTHKATLGPHSRPVVKKAVYMDVDPDHDGDNDLTNPDESKESAAFDGETPHTLVYLAEAGSRHSQDDKARIQSIHDSAHSIVHHAVEMLGPSTPPADAYGSGFLPMMQSTRESDLPLLESGEDVAITDIGVITSFTESTGGTNKGTFDMTIIRPGFNTSGKRYYTKGAITEAATKNLFTDRKMYIDHPTVREEKELPERSFSRIGAVIKETYLGTEGELRGRAAIVNPQLKETLALYKEQGVLHHVGVSINATGTVREGEVEGRQTHIVEGFTSGKSVDFVTEPGAGGRIGLYESDRGDAPVMETHKEPPVNEEQAKQILAELAEVKESNAKLSAQLTESDKRATDAEARAAVQAKVATRLAAVSETELPAIAKERIARMFESATNADRLEEAVTSEIAYIKSAAEAIAPKAAARGGVTGLGSRVTEGAQDVIAPSENKELVEAMSSMFGGAESARDLIKQMVG
jgi:hypothetical protein